MRLRGSGRGASSPPAGSGRAPSTLVLLHGERAQPMPQHAAVVLETTVDDLSPELVPLVLDRLREAGADDAWAVPVLMKKGRPGHTLTALAGPAAVDALADVLFRESSTFGLRLTEVRKRALPRRWMTVDVDGEPIRAKLAELDGRVVTTSVELEDVRAAAARLARPARAVQQDALAAARARAEQPAGDG